VSSCSHTWQAGWSCEFFNQHFLSPLLRAWPGGSLRLPQTTGAAHAQQVPWASSEPLPTATSHRNVLGGSPSNNHGTPALLLVSLPCIQIEKDPKVPTQLQNLHLRLVCQGCNLKRSPARCQWFMPEILATWGG
jgi:hypothetical protein